MATVKVIEPQAIQPERLRVAAYCRVSSDSKDQLHSYAAQIRSYTEEIAQHDGWELVDVYADEGLTGTRMDKREDFNRMMRDCRKGKIDRILVKHLRWVRNQLVHDSEQLQLCEERDIQDTNSFYDDIVLGCDPLTQLRRYQEDHLAVKKSAQRAKPVAMPTVSDHSDAARQPRRTGCFPVAILLLAGAAAIVIYFLAYLL